jgi:hypothetical protein
LCPQLCECDEKLCYGGIDSNGCERYGTCVKNTDICPTFLGLIETSKR